MIGWWNRFVCWLVFRRHYWVEVRGVYRCAYCSKVYEPGKDEP